MDIFSDTLQAAEVMWRAEANLRYSIGVSRLRQLGINPSAIFGQL